jgi:hypothetical protein
MALDKLVDFLAEEDKYWQRAVASAQLWKAKKKQVLAAKERYAKKRRHLAHYLERDSDPNRMSTEDIDAMALLEALLLEDDNTIDLVDIVPLQPQSRAASSQPVPPTGDANKSLHFTQCPTCNKIKVPAECSLGLCKSCCIKSPQLCKFQYHRRDKTNATADMTDSNILKRVQVAVDKKQDLWILYAAGTQTPKPRKITPQSIKKNNKGHKMDALCHIANITKSFYIHNILRVEDHNWSESPSLPQQQQQLPLSPTTPRKYSFLFYVLN